MEGILQTQEQIAKEIDKLLINFKKDGPERKTIEKIKSKVDLLETYWADFYSNHQKLLRLCPEQTEAYFIEELFDKTREQYYNVRKHFISYMETKIQKEDKQQTEKVTPSQTIAGTSKNQDQSSGSSSQPQFSSRASSSKTEELFRKQSSNFKAFNRTAANIDIEKMIEKWEFEDALKVLEIRWLSVDSLHWEIDSLAGETGMRNEYELEFNAIERNYNKIKKHINSKMWSLSHKQMSTPQMEIPSFNGSYQQWTSFKDLFTETVHTNSSLSAAQKMQFLKGKVKGEAEKLIQHLQISSDNYQICWDILNHRYNNRKLIFSSHLNTLLNIPSIQHQSAAALKRLHDTANECLHAIKNLGVDIDTWDPILVHLLTQKLDAESHNDYIESLINPRELPYLSEFMSFLENKFTSLETSRRKQEIAKPSFHSPQQDTSSNKKYQHSYKAYSTKHNFKQNNNARNKLNYNEEKIPTSKQNINYYETSKCEYCQGDHKLFLCKEFLELQAEAKRKTVEKYNLCQNCLFDHRNKACYSDKRCRVCNKNHNTLLHDAYSSIPTNENKIKSNHVSQEDLSETLLATALIMVRTNDHSYVTLRALIDQGSQTSLISEQAAQLLRLPRGRCKGVIFGVGAKENNCKGTINISCKSMYSDYTFNTDVYIMKQLINNLPNKTFEKPAWESLENIQLADPDFYLSRHVDLLLGAEVYSTIIQEGIIRHGKTQPLAQQTRLGWILCGNVPTFQCNVVLNNIDDIKNFWSVEDIQENTTMSQDEVECLNYYKETVSRTEEGRYIVSLPLKNGYQEKLGASKPMALAQFRQLEKKFSRQQNLAETYKKFIHEYQILNHMAECTSNSTPSCYLPHHCIIRPESTTTTLRVVFNASAKTSTGYTLNDVMYRGPNLQQDLMSLILKWRQYQYAFTADIEKMFRQILISEDHQKYQKILWRDASEQRLREYQLTTVTYGMKAAPFLAMMTLKQLTIDEGKYYTKSRASKALQAEFYMDDLVSGDFTLETAKQLQIDLTDLLKKGGFNLRKWSSTELLENVSTSDNNQEAFSFKQSETIKTLGLKWLPEEDKFTFNLKIESTLAKRHTKRTLLSSISKVFDPLGWLAPVTTKLKLLFKQVWLSNIGWDDQLTNDIITEWEKIQADLKHINSFKISRWYKTTQFECIELHGFCDASMKAYACVVYCKMNSNITIIAAKTRLVPENKQLTLPRLELCGAHLLSRLVSKIEQALVGHNIKTLCWSDSMAVLGWIQGDIGRWKPFVANRVKQITDIIKPPNWYYVKSADNPADCASRGISAQQLHDFPLWWNGPSFLPKFKEQEENKQIYVTDQELLKTSKSKQSNVTLRHTSNDIIFTLLNRHNKLTKTTRILAWVRRASLRHNIVIIHEPNLPAGKWGLGRVSETHPGTDGRVRVVTLKTKSGYIKRPVLKLTLLLHENTSSSVPNGKEQLRDIKEQRTSKKTIKKQSNIIISILSLLFLLTVTSASETVYNISKLEKALYFDRISSMQYIQDEWKLIVFYDMNPYWNGIDTVNKYIKRIESLCGQSQIKALCDIILLQLHHSNSELEHYNNIILREKLGNNLGRRRRGLINGVGYIANSLFGVLDEHFAEQYQKDIDLIRINQQHLSNLWRNQTSVVEAEYNVLKRTEDTIERQHKIINQQLNRLTQITNTEIRNADVTTELSLSSIIASNTMNKLRYVQDYILDIITNLHTGTFNIHLLSPEQLLTELNIISGQLARDISLPISNIHTDLSKIYHLLRIKSRVTRKYLIFEIKIPLINREYFDLYKIIPIPQQVGNTSMSIIPVSDHIAFNLHKDTYIIMNHNDWQKCLQLDDFTRLCHSSSPIYNFKADNNLCIKNHVTNKCETKSNLCRNNWVELAVPNSFLFFCCGHCTLRVICEDQITTTQVAAAGLVTLSRGCVIKGEDFTVLSHKAYQSQMKTSSAIFVPEMAPINHIINVSLPAIQINMTEEKKALKDIHEQIQKLKSQPALYEGLSSHDIHQYIVVYIIAALLLVVAAVYTWRHFTRSRHINVTRSQSSKSQAAETVCGGRQTPATPSTQALSGKTSIEEQMEMRTLPQRFVRRENRATSPIVNKTKFNCTDSDN